MMGTTKLNTLSTLSLSLIITYLHLATLVMANSSPSTSLSDKEDIATNFLCTEADAIKRIKQNLHSGKKEGSKGLPMKPMDCAEVLRSGHSASGVYTIWPKNRIIDGSVEVYCDMQTDTGGWTVIQRRGDYGPPQDYFYRDWDSYKIGFGDIREDFWLGNDLIFAITSQTRYSIRFDLGDFEGENRYALYDNFLIEGEGGDYRLHINNYSGDAGDSMEYSDNMKFSTKDRDNDLYSDENCAEFRKGAWWYNACTRSNLNGPNLKREKPRQAVIWNSWKGAFESLKTTEMKIRPTFFHKI